jgi:hypothetical protein
VPLAVCGSWGCEERDNVRGRKGGRGRIGLVRTITCTSSAACVGRRISVSVPSAYQSPASALVLANLDEPNNLFRVSAGNL